MLSEGDKKQILLEVERELYKRSFFEYVKKAATVLEPATQWDWNFHHEYICDVLQREATRIHNKQKKDKDIIINVPFRSSKTLIVSILYPTWCFAVFGKFYFINLSYSAGLSTDASNKVFEILHNPWYVELYPNIKMEEHHRGKSDFSLTIGGGRLSSGFLGAVLGRGADIIIMDDANSPKELTETGLRNTINTWKDTISTRLNQPEIGIFIVIQQRLHHNDLSGYLLKNHSEQWEHICLPAILSDNVKPKELKEKYINKLLWGNRFNRNVLARFLTQLGTVMFGNQLQQEPVLDSGNIIKRDWIKKISEIDFFNLLNDNGLYNHSWEMYVDTAYTKKDSNDPTGILIATRINNMIYVRKYIQFWKEFPDLIKALETLYRTYSCKIMRIEPKASGLSVIQQLQRNTTMAVTALPTKKDDKETALRSVSPLIESGRFVLIEDESNETLIAQLIQFPRAAHDEGVDLTYYSLQQIGVGFNYAMV